MDLIRFTACVAALMVSHSTAVAQQYPAKPVRIVVGFAAGGATDISARTLAQKVSQIAGQQVIVDNRPGASSNLAADIVARSAPDGYTVLLANATIAMPTLFAKLPFDVRKDLRPVSLVGYGPLALTAHPSLPVKSVKDLVALAKRRPGELNYASAGAGSFTHLGMALFTVMTGTNIVHVPYKGGAPALPDVPSVAEAGVPGYEASSWYGMLVPAKTPPATIARLGELATKSLADTQLKDRRLAQGIESATGGIEEFASYLSLEIAKWAKVISAAAIPPQ